MKNIFPKIRPYAVTHKFVSAVIVLIIIIAGYKLYQAVFGASAETRYVIAAVTKGTVVATVSGSGQVSAENQVDIKTKSSGEITGLYVKTGDEVTAGTILGVIDARDATTEWENAQLSYDKLVTIDPDAKRKAETVLAQAKEDLDSAYLGARIDLIAASTEFADILTGLNDIYNGNTSNGYLGAIVQRGGISQDKGDYITRGQKNYYQADSLIRELARQLQTISATTERAEIERILTKEQTVAVNTAQAAKSTLDAVTYLRSIEYDQSLTTKANNAYTTVISLTSRASAAVSKLTTTANNITNNKRALVEAQATMDNLKDGPDTLDLRTEELALRQKQEALADHYIRAPFNGQIATVDIKRGDTVSSGAIAITIITNQKIAEISLNEVDAAAVAVGQTATISFDALPNLSLSGRVAEIDLIGTVAQGVVTYNAKISFDTQDSRVRPGMSASAVIATEAKTDVLTVPGVAVKTKSGSSYVQIVPAETTVSTDNLGMILASTPTNQTVVIGIADDTSVEIVSGLKEGDKVVTKTIAANAVKTTTQAPSLIGGGGGGRTLGR